MNDIITRSPDTDIFVFVLHSNREQNKACCSILVLGNGDVCDIHLVINETEEDTAPPCRQGSEMDDGQLSIRWTEGDLLPQELVNVPTVNPGIYSRMDGEYLELENFDGIVFSEH